MNEKVIYNKSKTYLLPLLSELIKFDPKFMGSLENTFMYEDTGKYKNHLMILNDFSFKHPEFSKYEEALTDNELFVDYVDIGNKVLYIYKFPEEYIHEYNCLKTGRYSAFGVDAKELILKFWTTVYKEQASSIPVILKIKQILFKDKKLKIQLEAELSSPKHKVEIHEDAELGDISDPVNETFALLKHL